MTDTTPTPDTTNAPALAADEDTRRGPAAPVEGETYHGEPLVTPDVEIDLNAGTADGHLDPGRGVQNTGTLVLPGITEDGREPRVELISRLRIALCDYEGPDAHGDPSETLLDHLADYVTATSYPAAPIVVPPTEPEDFRPEWMTRDVTDRAYRRELIARLEEGLAAWIAEHGHAPGTDAGTEYTAHLADWISGPAPEDNGARRSRYTISTEIDAISGYHLIRALDASHTIERRLLQLSDARGDHDAQLEISDEAEGKLGAWRARVALCDDGKPEATR